MVLPPVGTVCAIAAVTASPTMASVAMTSAFAPALRPVLLAVRLLPLPCERAFSATATQVLVNAFQTMR